MATFDAAIDYVLMNEGSALLDDPKTGEYSKYGITLERALSERACMPENAKAFIDGLNVQSAIEFYGKYVWPQIYSGIRDQRVATKLFDMAVNESDLRANTLIQRACNSLGATLAPDGRLGAFTLTAINAIDPMKLLLALCAEAVVFYAGLVKRYPDKFSKYANTWRERAQKKPQ